MPDSYIAYEREGKLTEKEFGETYNDGIVTVAVSLKTDYIDAKVAAAKRVTLRDVRVSFPYDFKKDDALLQNGYQSWTDTMELSCGDSQHDLNRLPGFVKKKLALESYGDYGFVDYSNKRGVFNGHTYAYIRRGAVFTLFGSLNENDGFTVITFDTADGKVTLRKDVDGMTAEGECVLLNVGVYCGSEDDVFDRWFSDMDISPTSARAVRGYTSWYNFYQNIDENKITTALDSCRDMDVFQIDDGYESAVGDWLVPDEAKFPRGMAKMAELIHGRGMTAGIWIAPFVCEKKSRIFTEHKDWLVKDDNGRPIKAGHNWGGSYALDVQNPAVLDYTARVILNAVNDWGFDLLKLDFLYTAAIKPSGGKTRGRVMRDMMEFLRQLMGDKLMLACGVPLASAFGIADYCRIGTDVSLDWQNKPYIRALHREHASTKMSLYNTMFRRQLDGRAFLNDPDVFILRDDNNSLTYDQRQTLSFVNNLLGSLIFTSDDTEAYGANARKTYEQHKLLASASVKHIERRGDTVEIVYVCSGGERKTVIDMDRGMILK